VGRSPQVLAASLALFRKALGEAAAPFLIDVYATEGNIAALLNAGVESELQQQQQTALLFRETSLVTCIVSELMQQTSKTYVYKLLKPALKVYLKKAIASYEIDPNRVDDKAKFDCANNSRHLVGASKHFLDVILQSHAKTPDPLRELLRIVARHVDERAPGQGRVVASVLFFLRLMCPAIVAPQQYGIVKKDVEMSPELRRGLVLVGKVLQTICNPDGGNIGSDAIQNFIDQSKAPVLQFIDRLLEPSGTSHLSMKPPSAANSAVQLAFLYRQERVALQQLVERGVVSLPVMEEILACVENLIGPGSSRKSTSSSGSQLRSSGDMSPASSLQLRRPSLGSNNSPSTTPREGGSGSSPRAATSSISPRAPEGVSPRSSPLAASPLTAVGSPLAAFSSSPLASSCMLISQGSTTTTTPSTSTLAATTSSPNPPSNAQEEDDESESDSSGEAAELDAYGGEADLRRRSIPSTRATANEPAHVM
jgi:hypothetical protein